MTRKLVFVNIDGNPSEKGRRRQHRRVVASHIGTHYRNRSKPSRRRQTAKSILQADRTPVSIETFPSVPSIIYFKGNSDPFDSLCITVDRYVNDVIKFYRDIMLQAMAAVSPTGWTFWESNTATNDLATSLMKDAATMTGFLARAATLACIAVPLYRSKALTWSNTSMTGLRSIIDRFKDTQSRKFYIQIIVHFSIETLAGNQQAAALHAQLLRQIFQEQQMKGRVDIPMLRYVLHMDAIYSATFLATPLFCAREWCVVELGSEEPFRSFSGDGLVEDETTCNWQKTLSITANALDSWQRHCSEQVEHDNTTLALLFYEIMACHNHIIRSYLISSTRIRASEHHSPALYLAALFWLHEGIFQFRTQGYRFYDAVPNLYNKLRLLVTQYNPDTDDTSIWVLYTGAQMEQTLTSSPKTLQMGWFTNRLLAEITRSPGLSWYKIRDILDQHVYNYLIKPQGDIWFNRLLATAKGAKDI